MLQGMGMAQRSICRRASSDHMIHTMDMDRIDTFKADIVVGMSFGTIFIDQR